MQVYSDFASVYDELMDNIPYDEWFQVLHAYLTEYGIQKGIVAELGCGTGSMTGRLAACGYDMIGIDRSPSMLDIANAKKSDYPHDILYLCQDMRQFELYGTVAAIVSICDSINYITEPEELLGVFRLVNNYLDPGGILIFDFHTDYYYQTVVSDATIAEDRENLSFIWDNFYDPDSRINELALSVFVREKDDLYRKFEELHLQKGYTLNDIKALIKASGLQFLAAYDGYTKDPASDHSERICIIAGENNKTQTEIREEIR